jgi:hypothetical protein
MVLIERTVKIRAYPRILSSCIPVGTRKYHGGLGTVIYGGNTILTHNHYGSTAGLSSMQFWRQVDYIEVINYRGESERVDRDRLTLGLQNNPGTLIIRLPPWVNLGVPSAQLGNPDTLSPGESVQVVYEGGGGVLKAMWSGYVGLLANEPEPTAVLDDPSRVLDHGDSGGGLFKDSWWLVGNTWSIGGPGKAVFMSALLPDGI